MTNAVVTLLAVVVGALATFVGTAFADRLRFRRDQARHWSDKKLAAYAEYLNAAKAMNRISRRILAGRGIGERAVALKGDDALELLAEAEARRADASEMVALIGDADVVAAVRRLNREIWRLQWIARGLLDADEEAWEICNQAYVRALNTVHESVRSELHVPGKHLPREAGPPGVPELPARPASEAEGMR
ncbi:hypothetical protein HII36_35525 [Nonomuraea sp. NN258]|uniref:hypothetical protein n=1 Tax=Nonomuraea antri TaxID=2730852 RepID=UPI001569B424|nr:hypothetical protein [Nonomuraea antri]NRQ37109.1 hypothetical protein [Nonomuraea antri]